MVVKMKKKAFNELTKFMKAKHAQYTLDECGLLIDPNYPLFGASPDGISHCDCCGKGCIEIKCPYSLKDDNDFKNLQNLKDPYIIYNEITELYQIIETHKYYYQMQMQIFLSNAQVL